jgi:hypothetical protein
MMPDVQEAIALGIVALVAARFWWRRWGPGARRGKAAGGCDGCGPAASPAKEATVRFYKRRPDSNDTP